MENGYTQSGIENGDDAQLCPVCYAYMYKLKDCDSVDLRGTHSGAGMTSGNSSYEMYSGLWGLIADCLAYLFNDTIGYCIDKYRLNKAMKKILPEYPESLICLSCFHIEKKRWKL